MCSVLCSMSVCVMFARMCCRQFCKQLDFYCIRAFMVLFADFHCRFVLSQGAKTILLQLYKLARCKHIRAQLCHHTFILLNTL